MPMGKSMNAAVVAWLAFRAMRWLFLLAYLALCLHFVLYRDTHLDPYGHLFPGTELLMFALPLAAITCGFLELMMRERAGLPRPRFGRDWAMQTDRAA
ncbi:MAG: hypothetical protein ACJ8E1_12280 [Xanthobacteraceae bacterium]|jgi:hypothetical protein